MRDPVLGIWLPVELRALDVNVLIGAIKVDVLHCRRLARQPVLDADLGEIRRQDEVYVLSSHGPQTHHGESAECTHGAGVIITGDAVYIGIEL